MIKVLIGHRGVGKTSLLKRWKIYQPQYEFFDLDQEIERHAGMTVFEFITQKSEAEFRKVEVQILLSLTKDGVSDRVICCGAGIDIFQIPKSAIVYWIRRDSDSQGRILLDRPHVPIDHSQREANYAYRANFIYTMPEGLVNPDMDEKNILTGKVQVRACVTLQSEVNTENLSATYEWRDDLLTEDQFKGLKIKNHNILFSVRTDQNIPEQVIRNQYPIDWDLKRELPNLHQIQYLSTHEDQIHRAFEILRPYENSNYHLKLCPLVENWIDLKSGYDWQQRDPEKRNFLPRSTNGRWDWFRLYMKSRQSLNFIRLGKGSSLDQPTLWQWLSVLDQPILKFAAVLGAPVLHSHSPAFHKSFFSQHGIPYFKIWIEENDWSSAISVLNEWGLCFASITSPLKKKAGRWVQKPALNTIVFDFKSQSWKSTNTDLFGLNLLFRNLEKKLSVVVWGGGGLLESLKEELPQAYFYSARSGQPREKNLVCESPEVLVWAAGSADYQLIPKSWRLKKIIDLNYIQNSDGRKLAQIHQCQYISGLEMFYEQAQAQQKFWKDYL